MYVFYFLFLFKQKTAYEMRISDWSSDVCSSDLGGAPAGDAADDAQDQRIAKLSRAAAMGCRRAHQHSEDEDDAARRDREGDGPLAERQVKRLAALRSRFLPVVLQFRSEEHTSELQSLMRISYAVFRLKKKKKHTKIRYK